MKSPLCWRTGQVRFPGMGYSMKSNTETRLLERTKNGSRENMSGHTEIRTRRQ